MDCARQQADWQQEIARLFSTPQARCNEMLARPPGFSLQNPAWFERHSTVSSRMNDRALLYSFGLQLREGLGTVPRNDYAFAQEGSSLRTRCCFFFRIPDFFLPQHAKRAGSLLLWFAYRRIP